jgi:splicing suppressor protein 51
VHITSFYKMKQQVTRLTRRAPSLASGLPASQASSARTRLVTSNSPIIIQQRSLFGLFGKKDNTAAKPASGAFTSSPPPPRPYTPLYGPDDLFHPLESSPIPALRQKAATIKSLAPCPVCLDHSVEQAKASGLSDAEAYRQARTTVEKVKFSCPDCGFPTHSSEAHWQQDHEPHQEYCARLREINEDEHDLRSGREIKEFELPGAQDYESTPSLASWDALFYTRNFGSVDSERSRRHASKLLTYPMTIASVLHRLGPYAAGRTGTGSEGSRLTSEGQRSMAGELTTDDIRVRY